MRAKRATNAGEGKTFAQQTETNLSSYRPNVLTTSNKLDCHATARNDVKEVFPRPLRLCRAKQLSIILREGRGRVRGNDSAIADRATLVRNDVKTLVPQYLSALVPSKRAAFTLAEVLITLGIIGVVAAITMPTLISNHNKRVVETRLQKFYSIMNQAAKLSEVQYGEYQYWSNTTEKSDENGMLNWWNTYFAPHIKTLKTEKGSVYNNNYGLIVWLADGTKFKIFNYYSGRKTSSSTHVYFYPKANNKTNISGKDYFVFLISNSTLSNNKAIMEPYKYSWDGTGESLTNSPDYGCRRSNSVSHYCAALIEYNNWKIPDDYPHRF